MYVSFGSLAVLVAPMTVLGLSAVGVIELAPALRIIAVALVATLMVITLFAVRRLSVRPGLKLLVLAIMATLGIAVLAIELAVRIEQLLLRLFLRQRKRNLLRRKSSG